MEDGVSEMNGSFEAARGLEGKRVRMHFDDGHQAVATLRGAYQDPDGSEHLTYDEVEWSSDAECYGGLAGTLYYADGGTLTFIEPAGEPPVA